MLEDLRIVLPGALDDLGGEVAVAHEDRAVEAGGAGEVVDAVERDGGLDPGVGVLEPGLVLRVVRGEGGQGGQVSACGAAGEHDVRRVAAVLLDVLLDPGDRLLHVDDLGREGVARSEPVVDRHADPAALRHPLHQGDALLVLRAERPSSAVDLDQHRRPDDLAVHRTVDVEQAARAGVAVAEVAVDADPWVVAAEGVEQLAPRRRQVDRGRSLTGPVGVLLPEAVDQRLLGEHLHLPALADQVRPDPRRSQRPAAGRGGSVCRGPRGRRCRRRSARAAAVPARRSASRARTSRGRCAGWSSGAAGARSR